MVLALACHCAPRGAISTGAIVPTECAQVVHTVMQDEGSRPSHPINETRSPGDGAVGPIRNGV